MKRIIVVFICCLLLSLSSCSDSAIPVCPVIPGSHAAQTAETEVCGTEEEYALVDWMIFVKYNGRSYTRDFSEPTVIPEDRIGEPLGSVQSKPPSPTPVDYVTNVPDFTSFGYRIGAPFYTIKDIDPAYEIAVYDADAAEYHRLCYTDTLPRNTQIVRRSFLMEYNYPAVRLFEDYEDFSPAYREAFPAYDAAFFEDNVLAVVYLAEGSGSISHEVTTVRRVGDSIEIHIRREIPEVGTCDMAYWAIAAAISREDWDGASIVPCVSGYDAFPVTAKDNSASFYIEHPAYSYIVYRGKIYIPAEHTNVLLADHALGKQHGMIEHEIPETITAGYEAPDRSARNFNIGVPIYEISGMDSDYFIAAPQYEGGGNLLLYRYDAVLNAATGTLDEITIPAAEDMSGTLLTAASRAELEELFGQKEIPDVFSGMDDAFFAEHLAALIPFSSVRESTVIGIPAVYRMGDTVTICVQKDIAIPTDGKTERVRDVLVYASLKKEDSAGRTLQLWHTDFCE